MRAICHRCGGEKSGPFVPCKSCSFVPQQMERATAWLFSLHHLEPAELQRAAGRIRGGDRPDPGKMLQAQAIKAMGAVPPTDSSVQPLPTQHLVGIALANLFLTPLAGFAFWIGLRTERPRAAAQALRITLPIAFALGALWVGMVGMRLMS
jgi:hypothetical protein